MTKLFSNSLLILGIIEDVDIKIIKNSPFSHRASSINDLYESIKEKGLLQPIIVRPIANYFEIVAGNRRFEACKMLGWKKIICHIIELNEKESFEIALIENIQRKNLDAIEEAQYFREYIVNRGWGGISELATKIGMSVSYVDRRVKLLDLPFDIVESISKSLISPTLAEELLPIKNKEEQSHLANLFIEKKMSSRKARDFIKKIRMNTDYENYRAPVKNTLLDIDRTTNKMFDKSITILRIASNKLATLIPTIEENWIVFEILMQHKFAIDNQIDLLIKQKKKL